MRAYLSTLSALVVLHCSPVPALPERTPELGLFARSAGPVLERRCSAPPCHGNEERALRLYAPGFFRENPARTHREEPLTAAEQRSNEERARSFLTEAPSALDSLLVAKPLGRATHLGGVVFTAPDDEECVEILRWIHSAGLP